MQSKDGRYCRIGIPACHNLSGSLHPLPLPLTRIEQEIKSRTNREKQMPAILGYRQRREEQEQEQEEDEEKKTPIAAAR